MFIDHTSPKDKKHFLLAAPPIIIIGILLSFYGSWNSHYSGDDHGAFTALERASNAEPTGIITLLNLLTVSTSASKTHWSPVNFFIRYYTTRCHTLKFSVIVSLALLFLVALVTGYIALLFGACLISALFASAWISTAQSLVFCINTVWGPGFFLLALFNMLSLWLMICLSYQLIFEVHDSTKHWRYILIFFFLFMLILFVSERGIRSAFIAFGSCIVVIYFRRDIKYWKEILILLLFITLWVGVYFIIRYYVTDATIPFIRTHHETISSDYKILRFSLPAIFKNSFLLIFSNLNPFNSFRIYQLFQSGVYYELLFYFFPAFLFFLFILHKFIYIFFRHSQKDLFFVIFLTLAVITSLVPEMFIGKVSEMYSIQSLWPLAIFVAFILKNVQYSKYHRFIFIALAMFFVAVNIFSSRSKVTEINASSLSAYEFRNQLFELSKIVPPNTSILIIHGPRPKSAFGRFGVRGSMADTGLQLIGQYSNRNHVTGILFGKCISIPQKYSLIIREDNNYKELMALDENDVLNYQNQFCSQ